MKHLSPRSSRVLRRALPMALLLPWLTGCGQDGATDAAANGAAQASRAVNRDLVDGVPMGKPTAPVEVRFALSATPQPGVPFKVRVELKALATVPSMQAAVTASEGLVLLDPIAPVGFEKVGAGSTHEFLITAQAAAAGGQVVNVAVTLVDPLGEQTRAVAFPVLVGGSAMPAPVTRAKPTAGGEQVVPLKGTETTRP